MLMELDRPAEAADELAFRLPMAVAREAENVDFLTTYAVALVRSGRATRAAEFLAEQARRSDRWRTRPLTMRVESAFEDATQATAWLQACAANVPADDAKARVLLARAWSRAWQKFHIPPLAAAARQVLAGLTSSPDCPAEAWVVEASLAQLSGDTEAAKRGYVTALEHDGGLADAHNNLALILADAGQWKEAVEHATKATAAEPANANYLDTLAYALRRGSEFDRAVATLNEAIRIEPANATWRLSLAETLAESGKREDAQREAARAEELAASGSGPPAGFRKRMDSLRARLR
jgi:tetratricopeptide (TPR) repeat protein